MVEQQVDRALGLADQAVMLEHGAVDFEGPADQALAEVEKVLAARGEPQRPFVGERSKPVEAARPEVEWKKLPRWRRTGAAGADTDGTSAVRQRRGPDDRRVKR